MYPYVMRKYRYPAELVCYIEDEPAVRYTECLKGYLMIADVELDTAEPAFAVRYRRRTVFPVGRFETTLCTGSLLYALKKGYIKRWLRAAVYNGEDLFGWYVDYFLSLRSRYESAGNSVMAHLAKIMANSLYGKFGERNVETFKYDDDAADDYWRDEVIDGVEGGVWIETRLLGIYMMQHYKGETPHSAPAIAAHITDNARMELWSLIQQIGRDRVLYCDTDSVIVREDVLDDITWPVSPVEAGALKIQGRCSELIIDGAKNYRTDAQRHIKGIPGAAKEVAPGVFEYMHFKRMCMCLRERRCTGVPVETHHRRLVAPYLKGTVTSSGQVEPYRFPFPDRRDGQPLPF